MEYISLDEEDFKCLTRGGVLHIGNIHIALRDIGFQQMMNAIEAATQGKDIYKDHKKEEQ